MKILLTIISIFLFYNCSGYKPTPLTKKQILGEVVWQGVNLIDWGQTRYIVNHPEEYHENGLFYGKNPSMSRVNIIKISSAIFHPIITYLLPEDCEILGFNFNPRWVWLGTTTGITSAYVIKNYSIGIKTDF